MAQPIAATRRADWTGRAVMAILAATVVLNVWWLWRSFLAPAAPAHRAQAASAGVSPTATRAAPDFTLPLLDGGNFAMKASDAKVTVIDFFATWCGPCREELPVVDKLAKRYAPDGVRVIAVDAEAPEARELVARLRKELALGLAIAVAGGDVANDYHVENLPHLVIVGLDGKIARTYIGVQEEATLAEAIDDARKR